MHIAPRVSPLAYWESTFKRVGELATQLVNGIKPTTVAVESVGDSLFPPDMGRFDGGAAANLVLFMFLTALTGATAMVADREMGLDTRIISTPTSVSRLISGMWPVNSASPSSRASTSWC